MPLTYSGEHRAFEIGPAQSLRGLLHRNQPCFMMKSTESVHQETHTAQKTQPMHKRGRIWRSSAGPLMS
eukprot:40790-Eustigmatos_ZCMA.PRE.1